MNLYLISQDVNDGYDTYDSAVVVASTIENARNISLDGEWGKKLPRHHQLQWADYPSQVTVQYIGEAEPSLKEGDIICSSFNAG